MEGGNDKTFSSRPSKTAGTAHAMHPLGPLGVEPPVGFLIFRFEHSDRHAFSIFHKVAPTRALQSHNFSWLLIFFQTICDSSPDIFAEERHHRQQPVLPL